MWECRTHRVIHCVLHVVDHVSHVEHYFDRLEEAGLGVGGVHVVPWGKGVGVRQGSHEHLHADQEILQPRSHIILVVRRPILQEQQPGDQWTESRADESSVLGRSCQRLSKTAIAQNSHCSQYLLGRSYNMRMATEWIWS